MTWLSPRGPMNPVVPGNPCCPVGPLMGIQMTSPGGPVSPLHPTGDRM